jgi:hypothetical protein
LAKSKDQNSKVTVRKSEEEGRTRNSDGQIRSRKADGETRDRKSNGEVRSRKSDDQIRSPKSDVEVHKLKPDGELRIRNLDGEVRAGTSEGKVRASTKDSSSGSIEGSERGKTNKPSSKFIFVEGDNSTVERTTDDLSSQNGTIVGVAAKAKSVKPASMAGYTAVYISQDSKSKRFDIKLLGSDVILHRDEDFVRYGVKEKEVERRAKLDVEFSAGLERMKKYFNVTFETFAKAIEMNSDSVFTGVMAGNKKKSSRSKRVVKAGKKAH